MTVDMISQKGGWKWGRRRKDELKESPWESQAKEQDVAIKGQAKDDKEKVEVQQPKGEETARKRLCQVS